MASKSCFQTVNSSGGLIRPTVNVTTANVVATFSITHKLDLKTFASKAINVIYKSDKSHATMSLKKPKVTALIWSSGSIICTGSKSVEESLENAKYVARLIKNLGFKVSMRKYRVVNMLSTCAMPFTINTHNFCKHSKLPDLSWNQESTSAPILKFLELKTSATIFHTGKITIKGNDADNIQRSAELIYDYVQKYRNEVPPCTEKKKDSLINLRIDFRQIWKEQSK